jgi:hypothetical protein
VPEVAGNYVVHVRLNGLDIQGSPYNTLVRPGEISSLNSYTTITNQDIKLLEAGITYLFTIRLVDIYKNPLIDGSNENEISIMALY